MKHRSYHSRALYSLTAIFLIFISARSSFAGVTPGPFTPKTAEYKYPALIQTDVRDDVETELWARVFWPENAPISSKLPILFFLHGNHATCGTGSQPRNDSSCDYSAEGACPEDYVVVPNHEGYNPIAEHLATHGYIVVSINANRGVTCHSGQNGDWGANLIRGRLILKHMEKWAEWNSKGGLPQSLSTDPNAFKDRVALHHTGIMGHSRGGEGARAALTQYQDSGSPWPAKIPGLKIEAIYEIGAVDGQTDRTLDAKGVAWNQLLPACDGDVYNLQGANPFDRMLKDPTEPESAQKSLTLVFGANHNFFNSEWQRSDASASRCFNHTPIFDSTPWVSNKQMKVNLELMSHFFRAHVGENKDLKLSQIFDPMFPLPSDVTGVTRVDRDFVLSPSALVSFRIDDFDQRDGKTSRRNDQRVLGALQVENQGERAELNWAQSSSSEAFEIDADPVALNFTPYESLEFRVSLGNRVHLAPGSLDFSVSLIDVLGVESARLKLSDFVALDTNGSDTRLLFQTVRIPLSVFKSVDLTMTKTVRFTFDQTKNGRVYLANLWLVKPRPSFELLASQSSSFSRSGLQKSFNDHNFEPITIRAHRSKARWLREESSRNRDGEIQYRLSIESEVPFLPQDSLLSLKLGERTIVRSQIDDYKTLKKVSFLVTEGEYREVMTHNLSRAQIYYGGMGIPPESSSQVWSIRLK